ncbi:MAG: V-type ATP synthase subunit D, partial [Gammaproteobacteria bacterium]|nr:V-type ATP synthase subunit D [Gammaproteobacteria bacterium]
MTRLRTAPTKSALLNLRKQVRFLEDGHALLERKRELLTRLVYQHIKQYREKKQTAHASLRTAYRWLSIAQLRMGDRSIIRATLGAAP